MKREDQMAAEVNKGGVVRLRKTQLITSNFKMDPGVVCLNRNYPANSIIGDGFREINTLLFRRRGLHYLHLIGLNRCSEDLVGLRHSPCSLVDCANKRSFSLTLSVSASHSHRASTPSSSSCCMLGAFLFALKLHLYSVKKVHHLLLLLLLVPLTN